MPGYDPVRDLRDSRNQSNSETRNSAQIEEDRPERMVESPITQGPLPNGTDQGAIPKESVTHGEGSMEPIAYQPTYRWSEPTTILTPMTIEEMERRRFRSKNPLRHKERNADESVGGRIRPYAEFNAENGSVAEHYNKRQNIDREARESSPIIPLKRFNNWIKSALIAMYAQPALGEHAQARVLEMGCGKGGDLMKWDRQHPSILVMIDVAEVSVDQARERYESGRFRWPASFFAFDCFREPLSSHIPQEILAAKFDTISLQFCMHYGWDTEEHARVMLENIAQNLRPGGTFIGTTPDSETLMGRLEAINSEAELSFGNENYRIEFEHRYEPGEKPFGNKYHFWLEDAVDDVPEYVVEWATFERLAEEYGLKLLYRSRFDQILADGYDKPRLRSLLERMRVVDPEQVAETGEVTPAMPASMWDVCTLYIGFAFEKVEL
ncbi:mRNA (guanine-N(7))-methyltransferase [Malassezia yamatoensis]|uniref:mRNA cap guanine-N(7) methyltransferase n=1 Tax=Malassezia yamatoensis TaxID=253288 RepID=A0AAJ5YQQ7_9BASI|nr:mRNA (guanine-N(7))-methyltransferase [Malassezia yamatoensis]